MVTSYKQENRARFAAVERTSLAFLPALQMPHEGKEGDGGPMSIPTNSISRGTASSSAGQHLDQNPATRIRIIPSRHLHHRPLPLLLLGDEGTRSAH